MTTGTNETSEISDAFVTSEAANRKTTWEDRIAGLRLESTGTNRRMFNQMANRFRFRTPEEQWNMLAFGTTHAWSNMPKSSVKKGDPVDLMAEFCDGTLCDEEGGDDFSLTLAEAEAMGTAASNVEIKWFFNISMSRM